MRATIALCLVASIGALAGKWALLSQTESRAAELSAQISPLVDRIQVVPGVVAGLHDALSQLPKSTSLDQVAKLEQGLNRFLATGTLPRSEHGGNLSQMFGRLVALQRQIVAERAAVDATIGIEARRLEDLSATLGADLPRAVQRLADTRPLSGRREDRSQLARRLVALTGIESDLSVLIIHTWNLAQLSPEAALAMKPRIVRQLESLTAHLSRLPEGQERHAFASQIAQFRRAILGPGHAFARIRALQRAGEARGAVAAETKRTVDDLSAWSETSAAEAATAFRRMAEKNRVTVAQLRFFDLASGLVFWLGCLVLLWVLVERKLFARIEKLVAHKRQMAAGDLSRPVVIGAEDEFGELEHAVERSRVTAGALADANAQLHAVLDGAPDGILTIGEDAVILDANPATARMFGYAAHEIVGCNVETLLPARDRGRHLERFAQAQSGEADDGEMVLREVNGLHRDGTEFPLEISLSLAETSSGRRLYIGMIRDISARKAAEARLLAALAELERSNADLDDFAYVASHDLKAPLRVIDNASLWLEEDLAQHLTDDTRESMDLLRGRVRRMEKLLDDLLAYSRVGRVPEVSRMVTGVELVEDLRGLTNLPEGFRLETRGDFAALRLPNMPLRNVLLNLVSNAFKHHDKPTGTVCLSVEDLGDQLRFEVADDGPGIAPEFHERVLRMFHTLRPRDEVEGSGMGLAMVKKYVEFAGGRLEILSDGTRGTRFAFTWPKGGNDAAREGQAA
ncbi:hypothetical protein U879_01625 [Defluviimonas sp. 20V17]|uniref:histidine kinase n=2 Tax=Allgaiera indica TaxID=765699 RepID=A0AAN4UU61_9RHOB|nr:hypothetical protein U879_01625 [Defluviimonas sp. 20V17]GHE04110.1 hypothetical protein GCM10008024_29900 [Allgaiera indica]SDX49459.1 PAS domain S-box-containing protein [Allgaiera indica]